MTITEERQRRNAERFTIDTTFSNIITDWAAYVDVTKNDDGTVGTVQVKPSRFGIRIKVFSDADPACVVDEMLVRWSDIATMTQ